MTDLIESGYAAAVEPDEEINLKEAKNIYTNCNVFFNMDYEGSFENAIKKISDNLNY